MKKFILLIWITLLALTSCSTKVSPSYVVFEKDGKYGFIDTLGNVVIKPEFVMLNHYRHGLALAVIDTTHIVTKDSLFASLNVSSLLSERKTIEYKYGFINKKGEFAIPPTLTATYTVDVFGRNDYSPEDYMLTYDFRNGLAPIQDTSGLYGFMNTKGEVVIGCQYIGFKPFSSNRAAVQHVYEKSEGINDVKTKSMKWAIINEKGELLSDFIFTDVEKYNENRSIVSMMTWEESTGDIEGEISKDDDGKLFVDRSKVVKSDEPYPYYGLTRFLIDENGKIITELNPLYAYGNYNDGVLIASPNALATFLNVDKHEFIDKDGHPWNMETSLNDSQRDSLSKVPHFIGFA